MWALTLLTNVALTQSDTTPPELVNFQVSESCIDVSNNSVDVVFTADATDDLSGIDQVLLLVFSPNNNGNSLSLSLVSGTINNGTFESTISFDNTDVDGVHTFFLILEDSSGNESEFSDIDLTNLGFQGSIKLINTNSDTTPPELVNFQVSESCIDVSNNSVDVVFTVDATDDLSGIDQVLLLVFSPNNNVNSLSLNLVSGTINNGTFESTISFDNTDIDGVHTFFLILEDSAGNESEFSDTDLTNLGFQGTIRVSNQPTCVSTDINTIEVSESNYGLVYYQSNNNCHRINVADDGTLTVATIPCTTSSTDFIISCGSLYINSTNPRLVLKSPNNNCWKVHLDSIGNISTQPTNCMSGNSNTIVSGDIVFDNHLLNQGVVLKTSNNTCGKLILNSSTQLENQIICCPN